MDTVEIDIRLKEVGVKLYDIKQLVPLYKQVCLTLSKTISSRDELLGGFWVMVDLPEGKTLGLMCILIDRLFYIAGVPQKGTMISKEFAYSPIKNINLQQNQMTKVYESMTIEYEAFTVLAKGLKGFIPSESIEVLRRAVELKS